ncbi:hypothetical protein [Streptomyces sp. NPDC060022]|uniref:hypothetical protein n=1 Tax=Streptomyces sp. NPDC060022 TaxID=3347039 RepID=UPI0036C5D59E
MPKSSSSSPPVSAAPVVTSAPKPFLLTAVQGEAARRLLAYVGSLPLSSSDAQLLAVVVAIRAARGGVGNLTGQDLKSLRLDDAESAVTEVAALGWQVRGDLIGGSPDTPVAIAVPDLADTSDRRLVFGKDKRSRVSGWTTRTLAAKPARKTSSAARLAALFLAAHAWAERHGTLPADLPVLCRAALPELLTKGFLLELEGDRYLLADAVRHLSGMHALPDPSRPRDRTAEEPLSWDAWKAQASVALRRHAEAVEHCPRCHMATVRVAEAFMRKAVPAQTPASVRTAYGVWKDSQPDCGPRAAEFAAAFRAEHGHGPSVKQLCVGLGWKKQSRDLRILIVRRLIADEWLTNTEPVPWTLRPGRAAQTSRAVTAPVTTGARPA